MPNLQDMRRAHASVVKKADDLMKKYADAEELPEDVSAEIDALLGKSDALGDRVRRMERLEEQKEHLDAGAGPTAGHLNWRPSGPNEGDYPVDKKSWRDFEVKTPFGPKQVRYNIPLSVQQDGYEGAFESYLRKGFAGVGPNDKKTLLSSTDTAGGFLVPEGYQTELLKKLAVQAIAYQLCRTVQTSTDAVSWPFVKYTTDDKYSSPVRMTWTGDAPASASTHRVTDPTFGMKNIPVKTAMASMPIGMNMIEDSAFDVVSISNDMLTEGFALGSNNVIINGDGVNEPMGFLTQVDGDGPASVVSGADGAIKVATDGYEGYRLDLLYYTLPAQYRRQAVWLMNSGTILQMEGLRDADERKLLAPQMSGSLRDGEPNVLKARPMYAEEFMPDIATGAYPISFGDMSGYIWVERVGLSIQRLNELYAELNLAVLLARYRVGGYLAEPWKMRVLKTSAS